MRPHALLTASALLFACSHPGSSGSDAGSYSCDVAPILEARCLDCHASTPRFGAPMSLASYEEVVADSALHPGEKIYQRIAARVADDRSPMPQPPNARLTLEQLGVVQRWAAGGAAHGGCALDGGDEGYDGGAAPCPAGSNAIDMTAQEFSIPQAADFYQCFVFDLALPMHEDLIRLDRIVQNPAVIHHIVIFRDPTKSTPNGACFYNSTWQVLYAWAPGAGPFVPPEDVGVPMDDGDQIIVQVHYNNPSMTAGLDSSGVRFCVTPKLRARQAGVMPIGPSTYFLPPNCAKATISSDCVNPADGPAYQVFTQWPHMHLRGRAQQTTLHHAGADTVVESRPDYSFGAQYLEPSNYTFAPGDTLTVQCTFDTTGVAGGVSSGNSTSNEMCFNYLYLTPPPSPVCPAVNISPVGCAE